MDKASVIAIRDSLLQNGENRSVRIAFDNGIIMSSSSDIIFWNDDSEIIVALTADSDSGSFAAGLPIRVIGSTYENIQFIMGNTNNEKLSSVLDSLTSVVNISDDNKNKITEWYNKVLGLYDLNHKQYNPIDIRRD